MKDGKPEIAKDAEIASASFSLQMKMMEPLQIMQMARRSVTRFGHFLKPSSGWCARPRLEGLNDDEGDDGGHADLDKVAGDGGERHHPVAIDHDLGEVIADRS